MPILFNTAKNKVSLSVVFLICTLAVLLCSRGAFAVEVSSDIANDTKTDSSSRHANGGFFELGLVLNGGRSIWHQLDPEESDDFELGVGLEISAGYRYGRLFFEASENSFGGLNAGITLAESEHWDVDLLLANISGTVTIESDEPPTPVTELERNEAILDRDSLYIAAGGRLTGFFGNNLLQLRVLSDWYDGNGLLGSVRVGKQWQLGNWNAQTIAGVRYYSGKFSDYQYGVDADEQSVRFPAYKAGSAWIPEVEFGLSVPVRENWVYASKIRYTQFPDEVTDSPLINRDDAVYLSTGFHYVF